ncbi:hypothetical protein BDN71DRAFT_1439531 [Pleurotus eryngii]|uniref:Uncharacterized protein n=1 Tax=Pleurotus eryngii TaxID=5323 RepID=A0A9P6DDU5_PLEER|nr:hypothetical protein BDN71DRAFT_1439531 [Pleurotus eryngii]
MGDRAPTWVLRTAKIRHTQTLTATIRIDLENTDNLEGLRMPTSQDGVWKSKEQAEEARCTHEKEQAQLAAIRDELSKNKESDASTTTRKVDRDFEGGFGGQEDLEDRYATTSGEH